MRGMFSHALLLGALAVVPASASAMTYSFDFSGDYANGSGKLTTSDTVDAVGGYDTTSISGTFDGLPIIGLVPNPTQPYPFNGPIFTYDNVLFSTSTVVFDGNGILFTTAAMTYNIFDATGAPFPNPTSDLYSVISFDPNEGLTGSFGTFTLAPVPEPASWAMFIGGFGLIGFAERRRRTSISFA